MLLPVSCPSKFYLPHGPGNNAYIFISPTAEVPGPIRGHRKTLPGECPSQMMASLDNLGSPRAKCLGIWVVWVSMCLRICVSAPCECSFGVGFCVDWINYCHSRAHWKKKKQISNKKPEKRMMKINIYTKKYRCHFGDADSLPFSTSALRGVLCFAPEIANYARIAAISVMQYSLHVYMW